MRHVHLDPVGGIAGDMFAAAMLDLLPALGDGLVDGLRKAGLAPDVAVRWEPVTDEILAGARFVVDDPRERAPAQRPRHHAILVDGGRHAHAGPHVAFRDIRSRIEKSGLARGVIARALDIFGHLARAEAHVHGFAGIDDVVFHEVGAMDSVADIVAAAWLIEGARATSWSCGPAPLGRGTVKTAHGALPVPAPATAFLLEGFPVVDDGFPGERVTPTGAAILKHLGPSSRRPSGTFGRCGVGWGTKRFPGLPNVLRASEIDVDASLRDVVSVIAFEIDDQTAEDLALGLEKIRAIAGVVDVLQSPAFGKKGRMVAQVRVLARVDAEDAAVSACLTETTTLGVRIERAERVVLAREERVVGGVRTKRAVRPDGSTTAKADVDDVTDVAGAAARSHARRRAEDA